MESGKRVGIRVAHSVDAVEWEMAEDAAQQRCQARESSVRKATSKGVCPVLQQPVDARNADTKIALPPVLAGKTRANPTAPGEEDRENTHLHQSDITFLVPGLLACLRVCVFVGLVQIPLSMDCCTTSSRASEKSNRWRRFGRRL